MSAAATTIDDDEIAKFSAIAEEWWDPTGKFAPLHRINPLRLNYIREHAIDHFKLDDASLTPLEGLKLIDIGCGGGLVSEPLAKMGAQVTGIDGSEKNIKTASVHAQQRGVDVDYRATQAETLAEAGEQFDIVLALEVIEHVADVPLFLDAIQRLLKPGGLMIVTTLNRTLKSYAFAIVGAEYVLRWLPHGTHDWKKFLKPHEIVQPLEAKNMRLKQMRGMVLNPLRREWQLSERDFDVNYLLVLEKLH
jgi:2-polyprenyl-6-hydroxyphenyl methylase/3-demethylubiquinone-9 3-methyltransferase